MRHLSPPALASAAAFPAPFALRAQTTAPDNVPVRSLGVVTITGSQPTSLPTLIPATRESVTAEQIARTINATDSKYFTTDPRLHRRIPRQWSTALGIDNLNNCQYWNFHPYPQRSYNAELRFDL